MAVQKKQDLRVVDKYFLIKLVIWTRKQDLRVVDKYFLIKLVTWTRDEIVYTYQSRSENKSNYYFFFFLHLSSEHWKNEIVVPGTEVGWRGKGGGGGGQQGVWLMWGHLSSLSEEFAWNLRYSALGSKPLSFTHELAHGRGQPPVFQAWIGQWTKYIGKIKTGASFPFWPWQD